MRDARNGSDLAGPELDEGVRGERSRLREGDEAGMSEASEGGALTPERSSHLCLDGGERGEMGSFGY